MKSSTKSDMGLIYLRLSQVSMGEYERIQAMAHLQRAEAVADLLADAGGAIARLYRRLVVRPLRRVLEAG